MNQVPRFGDIASTLAENGYQPVPLHWRRKNPCAGEAWQRYTFVDSDAEKYRDAGTGLLCGQIVGVDIDVRNPTLSEQIEQLAESMFGAAPRRIGQAPKVLRLYQAEAPFGKIASRCYRLPADQPEDKSHRVEILAQGQQFVAFNIHPETERPYEWNGLGSPLTVPIGMLPTISERQAREFIAVADDVLARHGKPVGRLIEADDRRPHEPNEKLEASDPALFRDALAFLPNDDLAQEDWCRIMYATKAAIGEVGLKDFLSWSAKSKNKDVPSYSAREFLAAKPRRTGAGTVFYLATQAGWKRPELTDTRPASKVPEADEWPDPVNVFAELTAPPYAETDAPEELSAYAFLYAEQTGIDAGISLVAAVVAAAAAIPDQVQVCASSGSNWFAQARLWALTIAAPGAGKSPAQREMLGPLWKLHSEMDALWRAEVKALEAEQGAQKGPHKETVKPPHPRIIVGDATLEALSEVLAENERGVLVATDEFDAWLGAMDQYRSGGAGRDRGEWLRLFDGGPHSIERVKRGSVFVPNWGVSILTATTPAAMRRMSRNLPEDGLLQRFLIVLAQRQKIVTDAPMRGEIKAECERYGELLRRLFSLRLEAHNGVVMLSPEAAERFAAWRAENLGLQEALGSLDSALEAHVAKYPTLALRLALTFHCARIALAPNAMDRDPATRPLSIESLETALRFLRRESQHALALYLGRKGGSQVYELARQISRFIVARTATENESGLQRRDLLRRVSAFRDADEGAQGAALRLLIDLGWLRESKEGYHKAQPTRFSVNPRIAEKFAALAEKERQHRAIARERISEAVEYRRREPGEDG